MILFWDADMVLLNRKIQRRFARKWTLNTFKVPKIDFKVTWAGIYSINFDVR